MMKSSFLIGSIVSVVAPKMMLVPLSQPVPIHPFFLVGFAGLLMTAVNLLPIGVSSVCMLPFECDCYNEENS
jgi:mannose/fructose/N-acetylgalactosamine-specific phosphotransferase system component IIC